MVSMSPNAALIIIGNEILSGRTQDKNINYIAKGLGSIGVRFAEVRVIADDRQKIIDTINELRNAYDYVFTTGGIGPTHDDITSEAVAGAFEVPLVVHPIALQKLTDYYGEGNLNEGRLKMTQVPEGAGLIDNPISVAPGFVMENVYVMAGIPNVMQAMFDSVKHGLKGGDVVLSKEAVVYMSESKIAPQLTQLQEKYQQVVEVGSYPFVKDNKLGVSVVLRSADEAALEQSHSDLKEMLAQMG